jgi:YidC/Oxa1 family membrane protein insertase
MFTTIIVQPIFNLLVLIYALLPGHNFGLSIIIFTIVIRLLMWPLVKKQITQAKAMRELAPEIKKIKAAAKGNRQEESRLTMELYKEREINPFASLGIVFVQLPILLGLYKGLSRIIHDPHQIVSFSYPFLHHLPWLQHLSHNIKGFDNSLFGAVNLTRTAVEAGGIYWAAMVIVIASALAQYFQSRQLMPQDPEARSLRQILSAASSGKQAEQSEVNAAVGKSSLYLMPLLILFVSLRLAVALPLYWLVGAVVAYFQQSSILGSDVAKADASVIASPDSSSKAPTKNKKNRSRPSKKRKKR